MLESGLQAYSYAIRNSWHVAIHIPAVPSLTVFVLHSELFAWTNLEFSRTTILFSEELVRLSDKARGRKRLATLTRPRKVTYEELAWLAGGQ